MRTNDMTYKFIGNSIGHCFAISSFQNLKQWIGVDIDESNKTDFYKGFILGKYEINEEMETSKYINDNSLEYLLFNSKHSQIGVFICEQGLIILDGGLDHGTSLESLENFNKIRRISKKKYKSNNDLLCIIDATIDGNEINKENMNKGSKLYGWHYNSYFVVNLNKNNYHITNFVLTTKYDGENLDLFGIEIK